MTLYVITGCTIAIALAGIWWALQEPDTDRARGLPAGSFERWTLEGGLSS